MHWFTTTPGMTLAELTSIIIAALALGIAIVRARSNESSRIAVLEALLHSYKKDIDSLQGIIDRIRQRNS